MKTNSAVKRLPTTSIRFWLALFAFLIIIFVGYRQFLTFATLSDLGLYNLYALALVAGFASFFSPCAFPLLPGYFSFYFNAQDKDKSANSKRRSFQLGLAAVFGVITFDLLLGGGIAVFGSGIASGLSISGSQPNAFVQIFRAFIGILLLILGIGQLLDWNLKTNFMDAFVYRMRPERKGKRSGKLNMYMYGLGYTAAGMGCTGPILAGLITYAISIGGIASALSAFLIFSISMGALMLLISMLVASSQENLINRLKAAAPKIKTVSATLLIFVGGFNLFTTINSELFLKMLFP